ncbi:MAG: S9 family peptidase [candidate division Zixibacteria bacterium]|nr:S9 family peptidase [candidate division Zixibacteria bacterium]
MRIVRILILNLSVIAVCVTVSCGRRLDTEPPVAKVEPRIDTMFEVEMVDNYSWLRDDSRSKPEVLDYLKAENAYTEAVMYHTEQLQDALYNEMLGRIKETDLSVPAQRDEYFYYSRTEEGKQYDIYCRKKGSLEAAEEILLDVNRLAKGHDFLGLGTYEISPDHKLLAYSTDTAGNERYTLRVKNLETGELYPDEILKMSGSAEWANDNRTLFYTVPDDAWRPYKLYRHTLGQEEEDLLIYHEPDNAFWIDIGKSMSMKYLLVDIGSQTSSEVRYLDADKSFGEFSIVHPRKPKHEYQVYHHGDMFYIVTNDSAKNFRLMRTPVSAPAKNNWREVIPHRDSVKLDRVVMFGGFMVLSEREDGLRQLRVMEFSSSEAHRIEMPEPMYACSPGENIDFGSGILRFVYQSFATPRSVYDYDMLTKERALMKRKEVLGGFDPTQYQSERIYATAEDGTRIPISLVYKIGVNLDGTSPLYLNGYGAYGISMDPYFSSNRLSLLDRGFIYVRAHIRGGGEMGRYWYEDGRLLNKKNTFTDFIACGEHLIAKQYTCTDKLVINGGSAGGLLIGAVVNMAPELCHIAIADVPFVDVMNTMLDASIPLTVIEYEEWGNPNEKEYFDYMMSYSPYDNVTAKAYPHMLITGGLNDTRVQYWEPAKWTARLRALKTDNNRLLLKTNMGAGHGGASGRYDYLKEIALEYAFILDVLGVE